MDLVEAKEWAEVGEREGFGVDVVKVGVKAGVGAEVPFPTPTAVVGLGGLAFAAAEEATMVVRRGPEGTGRCLEAASTTQASTTAGHLAPCLSLHFAHWRGEEAGEVLPMAAAVAAHIQEEGTGPCHQ